MYKAQCRDEQQQELRGRVHSDKTGRSLTSFEKKPRLREGACRGRDDDLSFKNIKRVDSTEVEGEIADWADCNEAYELRLAVIAPLLSSLQSHQLVVGEATKKSNLGSTWSVPLLSRVQPWACCTSSGIHRFLCYLHDLITVPQLLCHSRRLCFRHSFIRSVLSLSPVQIYSNPHQRVVFCTSPS